jgi:hypothetical protein
MLPTERAWLNILRFGLLASACGWGISFIFTFSSWNSAVSQLQDMGASNIQFDPLMDYWLRMASATFGCIGIASALACIRPGSHIGLIRLLGPFHFIVGITLSISAYRLALSPSLHPTFIPDITFCFLAGSMIQIPLIRESMKRRKTSSAPRPEA